MKKLLEKREEDRISLVDALKHEWFKTFDKQNSIQGTTNAAASMSLFMQQSELVRQFKVKMGTLLISKGDISVQRINASFKQFDKEGKGTISYANIMDAIKEFEDNKELVDSIKKNYKQGDQIPYSEFIAANMDA